MLDKKICEECGKEFIPSQTKQKYCSNKCAKKHAHKIEKERNKKHFEPKKCVICGKEFIPKKKTQTICDSEECKKMAQFKRIERFKNKKQDVVFAKKCIICGEEFVSNQPSQILCGKIECKKEHATRQSKNIPIEDYPKMIGQYTFKTKDGIRTCPVCGKEFTPNVWNQIYCSDECLQIKVRLERENTTLKERICVICGESFLPHHPQQKCCNKEECKKELKRQTNKRFQENHKVVLEPIECKYCGKIFTPNYKTQIFCSNKHRELYYKENNIVKKQSKEWYKNNKEHRQKIGHEYYITHKEETRERARKNRAIRRATDPDYVLKCRIRSQIRDHFKRYNCTKQDHTFTMLGYTVQDLHSRLESLFEQNSKPNKPKLSWENIGSVWHIDHIRPIASFKFVNEDGTMNKEAIKECWSLDNLQPLYAEDNVSKSSYYDENRYVKGEVV